METHEKHDDKTRRLIQELVERAKKGNLFLSSCYGPSQEPVIVTHGKTTTELLPFKSLGARINGHSILHQERSSAHFERWIAVNVANLLLKNQEFRYSENKFIVTKRNFAQDIKDWGRMNEDN